MDEWEVGLSRAYGDGIEWQGVRVRAATAWEAEDEALKLGYYRNVRVRLISD